MVILTRLAAKSGNKSRKDKRPPTVDIRNDHIKVPVTSADQPAMIGAEIDPTPNKNVHSPIMPPAACLEKKSEAQAAYIDQQVP